MQLIPLGKGGSHDRIKIHRLHDCSNQRHAHPFDEKFYPMVSYFAARCPISFVAICPVDSAPASTLEQ
ncbi:hypothetical protein [Burkholderia pyrrocinia]|uniref:hypothetical protein n=1 Tax=Burkholderia pyrrocinia TaxID=60550 RepID=UPI002AB1E8F1|nr:hypothetical protein [Burkholderia pyrrocinia]